MNLLELPYKVKEIIFQYLNLEKTNELKLINKEQYNFIRFELRIYELSFCNLNRLKGNYYYLNRPYDYRYRCLPDKKKKVYNLIILYILKF